MTNTSEALIAKILDDSEKIFNSIPVIIPPEWFSSDLTVAQLRILLFLYMRGSARMSDIASGLGITLPTATGIVDNLVKKSLVARETDPQDRRLVICTLSAPGQKLINKIWELGQFQMEKLLEGLSIEQLEKCAGVADILLDNITRRTSEAAGGEAE
jgi:DNA-binding MarR family transcriptional regulator